MPARHLDEARDHLDTHHQQQSSVISAANRVLAQSSDLTAAAKTRATAAMAAELSNIRNCAVCDAIVADGVAATKAPV